ncbi:lipid droplet-associated hydrolase [Favolaschia claudopus]|uniref:Lipid droplet-associated hydrolase n=1 Tax=Favolaschia claudopus TaxID=2862362 RepID=A0AAW0EHD8_9AGAR
MATDFPPFLTPLTGNEAIFTTKFGTTHSMWWNCSQKTPDAVFLFIPGNPGLLEFYTPFLESIHNENGCFLTVWAAGHLGHRGLPCSDYSLAAQVENAIQAIDAVSDAFPRARIVVSGHSVGAWIALQVLKARPADSTQLFLLCPTLTNIADTPNGRRLSWLFRPPLPTIISWLSYLMRPIPLSFVFSNWYCVIESWSCFMKPKSRLFSRTVLQIAILRGLVNSPSAIIACLSMAHEEMNTIREMDWVFLNEHRQRLHLYYAAKDDWVSVHKINITRLFSPEEAARIIDNANVSHAFCLTHSAEVASQCTLWLRALNL